MHFEIDTIQLACGHEFSYIITVHVFAVELSEYEFKQSKVLKSSKGRKTGKGKKRRKDEELEGSILRGEKVTRDEHQEKLWTTFQTGNYLRNYF